MAHVPVCLLLILTVHLSDALTNQVLNRTDGFWGLSMLKDGGAYYMLFAGIQSGISLYTSRDFQTWTESSIEINNLNETSWLKSENKPEEKGADFKMLTPSLHKINETYLIYFAVPLTQSKKLCFGVASAESINGPYVTFENPLICKKEPGFIFSPYVFLHDAQKIMFYYYHHRGEDFEGIKAVTLSEDGMSSASEEHTVLTTPGDSSGPLAPKVIRIKNYYYMFYTIKNSIYVARSPQYLGPYDLKEHKLFLTDSMGNEYRDSVLISSFAMDSSEETYRFLISIFVGRDYIVYNEKFKVESEWPVLVN